MVTSGSLNIGIVVLAAGNSSRMGGQSKQLLEINGEAMLVRTINMALKCTPTVEVVLGSDYDKHRASIKNIPANIINNTNWQAGMGSSIKAGVSELLKWMPGIEAAIISVCDQPYLSTNHFDNLIKEYKQSTKLIVSSYYKNSPGVPVLLNKKMFNEILQLNDSEGAKKILLRHDTESSYVSFPNGEMDIDTPEEFQSFIKMNLPGNNFESET